MVRRRFGRLSVHPNIGQHLIKKKRVFDLLFSQEILEFKTKNGETLQTAVYYCKYFELLRDKLLMERGLEESEMEDHFGIDSGKNSLKVIYNLVYKYSCKDREKRLFNLKGSRQSIVILCVEGVNEARENIEQVWKLLDLKSYNRPHVIETDLKLVNIILGIGTHASTMPCPYCTARKVNKQEWSRGDSRTFQSLKDYYEKWILDGSYKERRKLFGSVEARSLLCPLDLSILVILMIPPPPLHLIKLGKADRFILAFEFLIKT